MLGPGIVWMALAQGSGELIWWPYIIAKYGLGFLFLLLPACVLQYPLTFEIGRYTLATGESIWAGFLRLNRLFAIGLWILMAISFLWFGAFASAGGTALAALTGFPPGCELKTQCLFWAYISIAIFFLALVFSRVIYSLIEKVMWIVAALTLFGLIVSCTHSEVMARIPAFLSGLVRPEWPLPRPWDPADADPLLTAVTFAGLGGFWTLFYSYWIMEKGAGMAAAAGHITGIRGEKEKIREVASVPGSDAESARRWRSWIGFLRLDAGIGIVGNILTTLMTCLLAYALLYPKGLLPESWEIAVVQARFFEVSWGGVGRALFLIIAAAFLADTWLSTVDAVARIHADMTRRVFPAARARSPRWWYFFFLAVLTGVTCATMPLAQPGPLIIISAIIGFVGTFIYSIAILVMNHFLLPKRLPAHARPGLGSTLALTVTCLAYTALMAAYLWHKAGGAQ